MGIKYFYTNRTKVILGINGGFACKIYEVIKCNITKDWADAEDRARTIALENNTTLAGGVTCQLDKENYHVITCPDDTTPTKDPKNEVLDFIMAFEDRELSDEQIISGFQMLINKGIISSLQGSYGRTANILIEKGYCNA